MDEQQLVTAAQGGDARAFGELAGRYQRALVAAACHMTRQAEDAEDLAQEALVAAYRALPTLRDARKFRGWLFAILRHTCLRHLRNRPPAAVPLEAIADTAAPEMPATHDLDALLAQLSFDDRTLLAARYLAELDYAEIAHALGITANAARVRCARARARLRTAVEQAEEQETRQWLERSMAGMLVFSPTEVFTDGVLQEVETMRMTIAATGGTANINTSVTGTAVGLYAIGAGTKIAMGIGVSVLLLLSVVIWAGRQPGGIGATPIAPIAQLLGVETRSQGYTLTATWQALENVKQGYPQFSDLACDARGNLFAVDALQKCIWKFDATGAVVKRWGSYGADDGEFKGPWGIAVDADGQVYVTDYQLNRIQKFSNNGAFLAKWGTTGKKAGELEFPRGIAVSADGTVYVADTNNHRIQSFDTMGQYRAMWNLPNMNEVVTDVALDPSGTVYGLLQQRDQYRLARLAANGQIAQAWKLRRGENVLSMAFTPSNQILLVRSHSNEIAIMDEQGRRIGAIRRDMKVNDDWLGHESVAVGHDGTVYVGELPGYISVYQRE